MNSYFIKYVMIEYLTKREYKLNRIIVARNEEEAVKNLKILYGVNELIIEEVKES